VFLSPVRELALQTYKVVTEMCRFTNLTSAVLVGGDSMSIQFAELSAAPDIIVATPGRLLHHLSEVPGFTLKSVQHIVLDEADRLFEMGLGSQVFPIFMHSPGCIHPSPAYHLRKLGSGPSRAGVTTPDGECITG
jgi:ATP-dependent RNA helicase DDX54/DBP10